MLPRASLRVLLMVVAAFAVPMLPASEAAIAGPAPNPAQYRYAGVVEDGRGIPTHTITRGAGILFYFFDSFSRGRKGEPYELCVGPPGKAAAICWKRTARYGVGKVGFSSTLPRSVPLGALTARWLVAGRTVARWPFFYQRGD
jgi:hypothetical protein